MTTKFAKSKNGRRAIKTNFVRNFFKKIFYLSYLIETGEDENGFNLKKHKNAFTQSKKNPGKKIEEFLNKLKVPESEKVNVEKIF